VKRRLRRRRRVTGKRGITANQGSEPIAPYYSPSPPSHRHILFQLVKFSWHLAAAFPVPARSDDVAPVRYFTRRVMRHSDARRRVICGPIPEYGGYRTRLARAEDCAPQRRAANAHGLNCQRIRPGPALPRRHDRRMIAGMSLKMGEAHAIETGKTASAFAGHSVRGNRDVAGQCRLHPK